MTKELTNDEIDTIIECIEVVMSETSTSPNVFKELFELVEKLKGLKK